MQSPNQSQRPRRRAGPIVVALGTLGLGACADAGFHQPGGVATAQIASARTLYTSTLPCVGRLVDQRGGGRIILVPDVVDGDEPREGTTAGIGPRRLANHMLVVATQNLGTSRVVAANDIASARRHAAAGGGGGRARIVMVAGGTLAQDDVRSNFADLRGGYTSSRGALQFRSDRAQFHMTLATMDEQGISMPGHGVELNGYVTSAFGDARLGISTGLYDFSVGIGASGTSVTRAQVSQILFQAGVAQIVARLAGVELSPCLAPATQRAAARPVATTPAFAPTSRPSSPFLPQPTPHFAIAPPVGLQHARCRCS